MKTEERNEEAGKGMLNNWDWWGGQKRVRNDREMVLTRTTLDWVAKNASKDE
jgi:hypothetical protein